MSLSCWRHLSVAPHGVDEQRGTAALDGGEETAAEHADGLLPRAAEAAPGEVGGEDDVAVPVGQHRDGPLSDIGVGRNR